MTLELRSEQLKAIVSDLDADEPRLRFARWLEDNAQPGWAEFIRLQCRAATLPEGGSERQRLESAENFAESRDNLKAGTGDARSAWLMWSAQPEFENVAKELSKKFEITFARGLPNRVLYSAGVSSGLSCLLLFVFPTVTELVVQSVGMTKAELANLTRLHQLPHLTSLQFSRRDGSESYEPADLARTVAGMSLPNIRRLSLPMQFFEDRDLGAMMQGNLGSLSSLNLAFSKFSTEGVRSIVSATPLAQLKMLNLESNPIGDEGASALVAAPLRDSLTYLNVADCDLSGTGFLQLAQGLPNLIELKGIDRCPAISPTDRREIDLLLTDRSQDRGSRSPR